MKNELIKIIDEPKLCRKLIFSLIGKDSSIQDLMKEAIYQDYFYNKKFENFYDYMIDFYLFIEKNLEYAYCIVFVLINLFYMIASFENENFAKIDELNFLDFLKRLMICTKNIKKKIETSTLNILISKTLKNIIYELSLKYFKVEQLTLTLKIKILTLIFDEFDQINGKSLETKLKKNSLFNDFLNIKFEYFFNQMFAQEFISPNELYLKIQNEIFNFRCLIKCFKVLLKNKWILTNEYLTSFLEKIMELTNNDKNMNYSQIYLRLIPKLSHINPILKTLINNDFYEKRLDRIKFLLTQNQISCNEIKKELNFIQFLSEEKKSSKASNNFIKQFLNNYFNNENIVLENLGFLSKIINLFELNPLEIPYFNDNIFFNSFQKLSYKNLRVLYYYFKILKTLNHLQKLDEQINKSKIKILDFVKENEIVDDDNFNLFCNIICFIKDNILNEEFSLVVSDLMNKILIYLKSFKFKEIDDKKILKYFCGFLNKIYLFNDSIDNNLKEKIKEIFKYLCERITILCLESPKLFSLFQELVINKKY